MDLVIYGSRILTMRRWLAALALFASCAQIASAFAPASQTATADKPNAPVAPVAPLHPAERMRVDYLHSGGPKGEAIALDAVVSEGAWPGSRTQLIDTTNLGKYIFEVIDRSSNRVLYSRGFATIYGEWETTPEFRSDEPHLPRIRAVSMAECACARRHQETRCAERVPAALGD